MNRWQISPEQFSELASWTKNWMDRQPEDSLGSKILLLDNWNEYGEGHYIAPHQEYGFEYMDAIRKVFAENEDNYEPLLPHELGFGPYNTKYDEEINDRIFKYFPLDFAD
jgi:hypothetical protein